MVVGRMRLGIAMVALVPLGACGRTGLYGPDRVSDSVGDSGEEPTDGPGHTESGAPESSGSTTMLVECDEVTGTCPIELRLRRAVDILFVVDNSGSMGGEQGTLARSFRSFVDVLEAQQVGANYRIGVTTTSGEGLLSAISCRERLNDFLFEWTNGTLDERQRGCLDHCAYESIPLANPWVERSEGSTNLPAGVDIAGALQCVGPPGINGPGFERPLEAMYQLVSNDVSAFLRPDALLAVIFLTDEADCSTTLDNVSWLQSSGVFWSDPGGSSSGVCWNAGVTCVGGPGVYDDCFAEDKGKDGLPTADPNEAVLFPTERYVEVLTKLAITRQAQGGQGQVLLSLIAGVPLDYPETGVIVYQDSEFPDFNLEYGIGPACNRGLETINDPPGIPDVRLRKVVESFAGGDPTVFSVCSDDYGIALESIAGAIGEISERACVIGCVADLEPMKKGLQPSCTLVEQFPPELGEPDRVVSPCTILDDAWDFPGPNVDTCYRVLDDPDQSTERKVDDMTTHCSTQEFNLELLVERREGVPVPSGTSIAVDCDLLGQPGVKCEDV